jgi:ribosome-associated heat shock protein Hsp15|tara:strand:- start:1339 stop:1731 length:393 start_codon:yes stop_codon:yes gene_type:complete
MADLENKTRLDRWLWAARFYKTRALASAAISGGKVHLMGQRVKSSRSVKVGDCFEIIRGVERFEVIVQQLGDKRGSAQIAQLLYLETEASKVLREHQLQQRKLAALARPQSDHKPNKQERRKIRSFTGKE